MLNYMQSVKFEKHLNFQVIILYKAHQGNNEIFHDREYKMLQCNNIVIIC